MAPTNLASFMQTLAKRNIFIAFERDSYMNAGQPTIERVPKLNGESLVR